MMFNEFYADFRSVYSKDLAETPLPGSFRYIYDPIEYVLQNKGKQLRPAILGALASAFNGSAYSYILPAAKSVEMIHNFTLLHDDIMDQDDLRHGRETVHKKYDEATAILSGDGLFAFALKQMEAYKEDTAVYTQVMTVTVDAVMKVCEGQAQDISFEQTDRVSIEDYLEMIRRKTSWLLAVSARIGAILGGASVDEQNLVEDIVLELGVIFQIQDDMLELTSDSQLMGKSLGSDLIRQKKTYPYLCAKESFSDSGWKEFQSCIEEEYIVLHGVKPACDLLRKNGIFSRCEDLIHDRTQNMNSLIESLPMQVQTMLKSIVQFILHRKN